MASCAEWTAMMAIGAAATIGIAVMTGMAGRAGIGATGAAPRSSSEPRTANQSKAQEQPPDSGGFFDFPFSGLCRENPVTLLDIGGSLC
jgi:hypothetical protein